MIFVAGNLSWEDLEDSALVACCLLACQSAIVESTMALEHLAL
tara:strand:+ start:1138 stop:1266 length:129 start_codon:yes stop_codon:yes gene_type:complete